MKKIFTLLMVVVMVLSMVACGNSPKPSQEKPIKTSSEELTSSETVSEETPTNVVPNEDKQDDKKTSSSKKETTSSKKQTSSTTSSSSHKHTYKQTVVAPTCTAAGYTLNTCACGESYKDNQKSKLGHSYGAWGVTKEATATSTGLKERKCTRCNVYEEEIIPKVENNEPTYEKFTGKLYNIKYDNVQSTIGNDFAYAEVYVAYGSDSWGANITEKEATFTKKFKEHFGYEPRIRREAECMGRFIVDGYEKPQMIYKWIIKDNTYPLFTHTLNDIYEIDKGDYYIVGYAIEQIPDTDIFTTSYKLQTKMENRIRALYTTYMSSLISTGRANRYTSSTTYRTYDGQLIEITCHWCTINFPPYNK